MRSIKKMLEYLDTLTEKLKLISIKPIFFLFSWKDVIVGHNGWMKYFLFIYYYFVFLGRTRGILVLCFTIINFLLDL